MDPYPSADGEEEAEPEVGVWFDLMEGSIRKRVLQPGDGPQPEMNQDVRCSFEVSLAPSGILEEEEGAALQDGDESELPVLQRHRDMRYRIGESEAVPALELCLRHMLPGEECEVVCASRMGWGLGRAAVGTEEVAIPAERSLCLKIVLHEVIVKGVRTAREEVLEEVTWRKANGNDHFKRREFQLASRCYKAGLDAFQGLEVAEGDAPPTDDEVALGADCAANLSACALEREDSAAARDSALLALTINPVHQKALYRAAKAFLALSDFDQCEAFLLRAERDLAGELPADFQRLRADLQRQQERYAAKSRRIAAGVFKKRNAKPESEAAEVRDDHADDPGESSGVQTTSTARPHYNMMVLAAIGFVIAATAMFFMQTPGKVM